MNGLQMDVKNWFLNELREGRYKIDAWECPSDKIVILTCEDEDGEEWSVVDYWYHPESIKAEVLELNTLSDYVDDEVLDFIRELGIDEEIRQVAISIQ